MSSFVHWFIEEDDETQAAHLSEWFGTLHEDINPEDLPQDHPVVCYCGAQRYDVGPKTAVVKHYVRWRAA